MIPLILAFWSKHKAIIVGILCALVMAVIVSAILSYGESRYKAGRAMERAGWMQKYLAAQARAIEARTALARVTSERDAARRERDAARARQLTQVQEEIHNAPDSAAAYAAYLAEHNRLRDDTAARHTRTRADYLSSLPASGSGDAGPAVAEPIHP